MGEATLLHVSLLSLLLFHWLLPGSDAEIKTGRITGDSNEVVLVGRFAFHPHGRLALSVFDVSVTPSTSPPARPPDYFTVGFFLVSEGHIFRSLRKRLRPSRLGAYVFPGAAEERNASEVEALINARSFCPLYSTDVRRLLTFRELSPPRYRAYNGTFDVPEADQYLLLFSSCAEGWRASMGIRAEMYSIRLDGSRDYLTAAFSLFPAVYTAFAGAYVVFLGLWLYVYHWRGKLHHQKHHRQLPSFFSTADLRVHNLVAGLLLAKALNLVFTAADLRNVAATGIPHRWDVTFCLLRLSKGALLLSVILLAWSAWPFLTSCLQHREKRILSTVLPLQLLANAAYAAAASRHGVNPSVEADPEWWGWAVLAVDAVCGFAVIFAAGRTMRALKEASATGDGKQARYVERVTLFRRFYVMAVAQLYLMWIVVLAIGLLAPYEKRWVGAAAEEATTLAFFASMCYSFRPEGKDVRTSLIE